MTGNPSFFLTSKGRQEILVDSLATQYCGIIDGWIWTKILHVTQKKKKKNYSRINTLKINKITHTNTVTKAI